MTTPHPHAEFFRAIAAGDALENWEAKPKLGEHWAIASTLLHNIVKCPNGTEVRRKPTLRLIDWSKPGRHVPVKVWDTPSDSHIAYLEYYSTTIVASGSAWDGLSLNTGLWVFNADGVNPWPAGCRVNTWLDGCSEPQSSPFPASAMGWGFLECRRIIASRFHSLEEGYSFGEESCS